MRITTTEQFRCSPEHLWTYLTEPEKQKQWMRGLLSNESTSPGKKGAGSTFRMVIQEGRKQASYDGEVTEYDYPTRLEVRFWGGNFPAGSSMRVDYRLSERAGGTRMDYLAAFEGAKPGFFLRLLFIIGKLFASLQLRSFLRKLKQLAEASQAPGVGAPGA